MTDPAAALTSWFDFPNTWNPDELERMSRALDAPTTQAALDAWWGSTWDWRLQSEKQTAAMAEARAAGGAR